jgi:hypothetical protein
LEQSSVGHWEKLSSDTKNLEKRDPWFGQSGPGGNGYIFRRSWSFDHFKSFQASVSLEETRDLRESRAVALQRILQVHL